MPALAPLTGLATMPAVASIPALAPLLPRAGSGLYGRVTNIASEDNGIWTMAETQGDTQLDLVYIKTRNTASGKVEVHIASAASNWMDWTYQTATSFTPEDNGTWMMIDMDGDHRADLVYIKTRNTGSGKVEVHSTSAASDYKTRIVTAASTFAAEEHGIWTMYDFDGDYLPDLVYIKDSSTGTGTTEVHAASQSSSFQMRIKASGSGFPQMSGSWQMCRAGQDNQYLAWSGNNLSAGYKGVQLATIGSGFRPQKSISTPFTNNSPGYFMFGNLVNDWGLASDPDKRDVSINKRWVEDWGKLSLININNMNSGNGKVVVSVWDVPT